MREERGLCYSIYSFHTAHLAGGLLGIYTGLNPGVQEEALAVILGEVERFCKEGPTADEFALGIRQIKTNVPTLPAFAGASKAEYLSDCLDLLEEKYGSIPGYLRAIGLTEEELAALRGKLLPPDIIKGGPALG